MPGPGGVCVSQPELCLVLVVSVLVSLNCAWSWCSGGVCVSPGDCEADELYTTRGLEYIV